METLHESRSNGSGTNRQEAEDLTHFASEGPDVPSGNALTPDATDLNEPSRLTNKRPAVATVLVCGASAVFVLTFIWFSWRAYDKFQIYGFDTGLFAQGTWLLAHIKDPFVTIRGLPLLGEHASYILIVVAPIYRLWPDPRMLLILQSVFLAIPALVVYRIGIQRVGRAAAACLAIAYLTFPATQWVGAWYFHPESLATGFLALGVLAAHNGSHRMLYLWLGLALLCKEDVSFVVFGFGLTLLTLGRRREAMTVCIGALTYFFVMVFIIMPITIGGNDNLFFERNYGIELNGITSLPSAIPQVLVHAVSNLVSQNGFVYLAFVLGPVLFLPLLSLRWLIPTVPPLILNFASLSAYQRDIKYQYLATSITFIAVAAIYGLERVQRRGWDMTAVLSALTGTALIFSLSHGPQKMIRQILKGPIGAQSQARNEALSMIPPSVGVSAKFNTVTHLTDRTHVYEFPNPFRSSYWGYKAGEDAGSAHRAIVKYVLVEPEGLGEEDAATLRNLKTDGNWMTVFDRDNVVLLRKSNTR